jgi:two-component system alkaline phosphatase synthesis response regulator PhoP
MNKNSFSNLHSFNRKKRNILQKFKKFDAMNRILVVEDESKLAEIIQFNLELEGYSVKVISNGKVALNQRESLDNFDLVVLDVMLPEVSGLDICRAYREHSQVPILFVSAKGNTIDRIAGLKAGGNDYLPKPFDLEEFLLRCAALIQFNNKKNTTEHEFTIGNYTINPLSYVITHSKTGETIALSKREMELIALFYEHRNQVVPRDLILNLWSKNDQFPTARTIDNFILAFRKVFEEDPKNPQFFHSIRGVGYKLTIPE